MRSSFIGKIKPKGVLRSIPLNQMKEESQEFQQTKINDDHQNNSFEVSFNLDQMYFDDENDCIIQVKNDSKSSGLKKQEKSHTDVKREKVTFEHIIEEKKDEIFQEAKEQKTVFSQQDLVIELQETKSSARDFCQKVKLQPQEPVFSSPIKLQYHKHDLMQPITSTASSDKHSNFQQPLQIPSNAQKPIIPYLIPKHQQTYQEYLTQPVKLIDFQVQVDISYCSEYSQDWEQSRQLSELDGLFINPENISKYNSQKLLYVKIQQLAKLYHLSLDLWDFVRMDQAQKHGEKEKMFFEAFMKDWKKSEERVSKRTLTLAKMRTIIIRDAMNTLVDSIVPPSQDEDILFRISKTYRQRYEQAQVPVPPPRVNNSYLQNLFSSVKIKQFYELYINEMLEVFLKEENFKKITIFQLELTKLFYEAKNMSQQELEKQLERKKKPFTQKEIEMIVEEGRKMGEEYGKKIKRIGNGCGQRGNANTFERLTRTSKCLKNPKNQPNQREKISFKGYMQNQDNETETNAKKQKSKLSVLIKKECQNVEKIDRRKLQRARTREILRKKYEESIKGNEVMKQEPSEEFKAAFEQKIQMYMQINQKRRPCSKSTTNKMKDGGQLVAQIVQKVNKGMMNTIKSCDQAQINNISSIQSNVSEKAKPDELKQESSSQKDTILQLRQPLNVIPTSIKLQTGMIQQNSEIIARLIKFQQSVDSTQQTILPKVKKQSNKSEQDLDISTFNDGLASGQQNAVDNKIS